MKETIVNRRDTGMVRLGSFKRTNIADILCQRWQLTDSDERYKVEAENGAAALDMVLFKDSSAVIEPTGAMIIAKWSLNFQSHRRFLILSFANGTTRQQEIVELVSNRLISATPEMGNEFLHYYAPAVVHKNVLSDPFHPVNNRWRIRPAQSESDSAIHARLKNCLLFFALYFRDHIKRNAETISFEGLPRIFTWYSGGIGLPEKDALSDSWINCFYNQQEANKGYWLLRKLIVDYEYNWPTKTRSWTYQTHSVLEQMYHRIDDLY